jgi:hypothetical protein
MLIKLWTNYKNGVIIAQLLGTFMYLYKLITIDRDMVFGDYSGL